MGVWAMTRVTKKQREIMCIPRIDNNMISISVGMTMDGWIQRIKCIDSQITNWQSRSQLIRITIKMKRKISICAANSAAYVFNSFYREFKKALAHLCIGEMLNSKQLLTVLSYMGFVEEEPSEQEIELSKTVTLLLSEPMRSNSVRRANFFKFLLILCDIHDLTQSKNTSFFEEEISGLALEEDQYEDPLVVIQLGTFSEGRWSCSETEAKSLREIFRSLYLRRMSRGDIESRKRSDSKQQKKQLFQPQICPRSELMAQKRNQKLCLLKPNTNKVEDRLLMSRDKFKHKIQEEMNKSLEITLKECTFNPVTNVSRRTNSSLTKSRAHSQEHLRDLVNKGNVYQAHKQRLKHLKVQLNQSAELQQCTFQPKTTKAGSSKHNSKWAYVRNRQKQIQRLRLGQQQREFKQKMQQRGYPAGVSWSQYMNQSKALFNKQNMQSQSNIRPAFDIRFSEQKSNNNVREPILCIDLKIMNVQQSLNVYEGDHIGRIAEEISRDNCIHESMWWRVEDLVHKAVSECADVHVKNHCIYSF